MSVSGALTVGSTGTIKGGADIASGLDVTGAMQITGGITVANGGTTVEANGVTVAGGMTIGGGGLQVTGAVSVGGDLKMLSGTLTPDSVTVTGSMTMTTGTMSITSGLTSSKAVTATGGVTVTTGGTSVDSLLKTDSISVTNGITVEDTGITITAGPLTHLGTGNFVFAGGVSAPEVAGVNVRLNGGNLVVSGGMSATTLDCASSDVATSFSVSGASTAATLTSDNGCTIEAGGLVASTGITANSEVEVPSNFETDSTFTSTSGATITNGLRINQDLADFKSTLVVDEISGGSMTIQGQLNVQAGATTVYSGGMTVRRTMNSNTLNTNNLYVNGQILSPGNVAVSDGRLKTDVTPIENALPKIAQLDPSFFTYNPAKMKLSAMARGKQWFGPRRMFGLLAQDLDSAYPTMVGSVNSTELLEGQNALSTLGEDEELSRFIDADAPEEFLVIYYDDLVPVVVEGAKALDKRITDCDAFRRERRHEMDVAVREVDELLSRSASLLAPLRPSTSSSV